MFIFFIAASEPDGKYTLPRVIPLTLKNRARPLVSILTFSGVKTFLTKFQAILMSGSKKRSSKLRSSLLIGHVRHRRISPVKHRLNYPLFMPCLDLDEVEQVEKSVWGFLANMAISIWWEKSCFVSTFILKLFKFICIPF